MKHCEFNNFNLQQTLVLLYKAEEKHHLQNLTNDARSRLNNKQQENKSSNNYKHNNNQQLKHHKNDDSNSYQDSNTLNDAIAMKASSPASNTK